METFRRQRCPVGDRFLGLFAAHQKSATAAVAPGDELLEDDVFWVGSEPSPGDPICCASPEPAPRSPIQGSRRVSLLSSGILAALAEEPQTAHTFLHRKVSFAPSSPTAGASPVASARRILAIGKPKMNHSRSLPAGKIYQRSAPVKVPVVPSNVKKSWVEFEFVDGDGNLDEHEMLPPHEIVTRASANGSPMFTFSVLEGAGRTLKGRDLRRVRNAVLQKTGFLD